MARTFGDVMKANRQKRIAAIVKAKMTPPTHQDWADAGSAKTQGKHQLDPMRAGAKPKPDASVEFAFDATNPEAIAAVEDHAAELIQGISKTTRDSIKDLVEEAFTDPDMDVDSLASAIDDIIDDPDRADLIARTETMQASNDGQLAAWDQAEEAGLLTGDEQKVWIAADGDRTCKICDDLDGESVARNETFDVDGDDLGGPPAHPDCRCTVGLEA